VATPEPWSFPRDGVNLTLRALADLNAEAQLNHGDELKAVQDFYVTEMQEKQV
jgi:hypothetical protein